MLHFLQAGTGIHDRVALFLVFKHLVYELGFFLRGKHKLLGTWIWGVEVDGNLLYGRVLLRVLHSLVQRLPVEGV